MLKFSTKRTLTASGSALPQSPSGELALVLRSIRGEEALSEIYTYLLDMVTPDDLHMFAADAENLDLRDMRSRDLKGGASNQIVADDTPGELQAQVTSDHANSRLVVGYNTRIVPGEGRKQARGEGIELATDAHGVIRANRGLLITTEARSGAMAPAKDMGETVQRLTQARGQHESLAGMAQQNQAQDPDTDQSDVTKVLKAQNDAIRGPAGSHTQKSFPELTEPHLVLASPAGIETTTAHSTHIASGEHIALTSGQHVSLSAGGRLLASVRNGIRLFCVKAGMNLIAAGGDIDLRALKDSINVLAKLNITQTANQITITAKEEVVINGGGSYTRWQAGGIETGTNGSWVVHSASKSLPGPKNVPVAMPMLPKDVCIECLLKRAASRSALVNKGN